MKSVISFVSFLLTCFVIVALWFMVTKLLVLCNWASGKVMFRPDGQPRRLIKLQAAVAGAVVFLRECERYICEITGVKPEDLKREGALL